MTQARQTRRMHARRRTMPRVSRGHALAETVVALLVFVPLMIGIPLIGKQIDIKHKTIDASRYAAWERTVWRSSGASNVKSPAAIALEARDRTLGSQRAGLVPLAEIESKGVTENDMWYDHTGRRLLDYRDTAPVSGAVTEKDTPRDIGVFAAPAVAHGKGIGALGALPGFQDLGLENRNYAQSTVAVALRPVLAERAQRRTSFKPQPAPSGQMAALMQSANGGILSDSWSVSTDGEFVDRVGNLTLDEPVRAIEAPGLTLGYFSAGKGKILLGEALYGLDADLAPSADALPRNYVGPPRSR